MRDVLVSIAVGARVGPYEIISLLGAGGMGEVYRARDTRLARNVAVKVLPEDFLEGEERKSRFELEAKLLAGLNHPNIAAVFSFEEIQVSSPSAARHLLVMELLEGQPLRERLDGGALPARKAVEIAVQIANGLAAAHEKGIVHRDLKPENIFVTKEGRVKILDFGLAKLTQREPAADLTSAPTTAPATTAGVVMGTVGYMSPEQVRGEKVDARSDIFAFGAVLYEMLLGSRAFKGASAVETMHAILKDDPPELLVLESKVPTPLSRIVRRCLEKSPDERFQSARDLGFALETLSGSSTQGSPLVEGAARPRVTRLRAISVIAVLLATAGASFFLGRGAGKRPPPSFHRLTFRHGTVENARFAPDGQTIVYSAKWGSDPVDVFSTRPGSPEARSLGLPGAALQDISRSGEMLVVRENGTLARVSLGGGAPRDVLEGVDSASWAPNGKEIAVVRSRTRLEFPIGKVLYETTGRLSHLRVSPNGDAIAFLEHPLGGGSGGWVSMVNLSGKVRALSEQFANVDDATWTPGGDEIWFSANAGGPSETYAVTPSGRRRLVARGAGHLEIHDMSPDGRALTTETSYRTTMRGLAPGETKERDLSWLDTSEPFDISADGKTVLFREEGGGAGSPIGATYVRGLDGSPAVRLGDGNPMSLSPDGKWALAVLVQPLPAQLVLLPTGPGEPRALTHDSINHLGGLFFPDGKRILFVGGEPRRPVGFYVQDLEGGAPRPIPLEIERPWFIPRPISPDGRQLLLLAKRGMSAYPVEGGEAHPVPGISQRDFPLQWELDGRSILVRERSEGPDRIFRVDLATGRRTLFKEIAPPDSAARVGLLIMSSDGRSYAYAYTQESSDLFLVEGLK